MTIQAAPFAPDVQYFLDCALEHGELDAGTHVALRLYATRSEVMDIIDDVSPIGHYLGPPIPYRLRKAAMLAELADRLLADLPIDRRGAVAWAGIQHLKTEVDRLAWFAATAAIEDELKGGVLKPYIRKSLSKYQRAYELSPKLRRKLYSRKWAKRYVETEDECRLLRKKGTRALKRLEGIDLSAVRQAGDVIARDIQTQHENYRRWNEALVRDMARRRIALDPREEHRRRRVIKRAASTAVALIGRDPVSTFASGRPVIIEGETINLEVGRVLSSATIGHGGLHVTAVCPTSGHRLADMCVYHEGTPALDQLTALTLAMRAGEESEILMTANLSRVSDLGRQHPLIQERGLSEFNRQHAYDEVREKNEAYWQETKAMWIDALGVFVLGRMWREQ